MALGNGHIKKTSRRHEQKKSTEGREREKLSEPRTKKDRDNCRKARQQTGIPAGAGEEGGYKRYRVAQA